MDNKEFTRVFDFEDYKEFLKKFINESSQRGIIKELAEVAQVHRPYLSNVLNNKVHLLPDQLFGICNYLNLSESESAYLHLLLERSRTSNVIYKKHLTKKINAIKEEENKKIKAIGREHLLALNDADTWAYYSHWLYPLVHIAVSIPAFQRVDTLSQLLEINYQKILQILTHLEKMGLIKRERDLWKWHQGSWHSPKGDPRAIWLHRQLRDYSYQQYQADPKVGTYFSVIQSISEEDFQSLKKSLDEWIVAFNKKAAPSKPEVPIVFCCDFFRAGKNL